MSFSLAGVATVKCMDWTPSSRELALSTVMGSLMLMFEIFLVFDVITVLFMIGIVASGPCWFENRLDSG